MSQAPPQQPSQQHQRSASDLRRATSNPTTSAHSSTSSLSSSSSNNPRPSQIPLPSTTTAAAAPPPNTPIRKPKTPRASAKGEGTSLGGGSSGRQIVRPSPPSGRRTPISPEPKHSPLPTAQTPSAPLPPATPTPAQRRKGGPGMSGRPLSLGSVRTTRKLALGNDRVDNAFAKAWRVFDPNDIGQITGDRYVAFVNTLEECVSLPKRTLIPPSAEEFISSIQYDDQGDPITLDQVAVNELFSYLGLTSQKVNFLDYIRIILEERGTGKKDLAEEDALAQSTIEGSFGDDSTGGLDFPSTGPVRGTTPSPGRSGQVQQSNKQPSEPPRGKSPLFVDLDDSSIYKVEDALEHSVLLSNTDLTPKAASRRSIEEIARVYAEVRRLTTLVNVREKTIDELKENSLDWEEKYVSCKRTLDSMQKDFDKYTAGQEKDRAHLTKELDHVEEVLKETRDVKDRRIRELEAQILAQQNDIVHLKEEAEQIVMKPKRDVVKEKQLAEEVARLERQLEGEQGKNRLLDSRAHHFTELQDKYSEELAEIRHGLKTTSELLASKDCENEELQETIANLQNELEVRYLKAHPATPETTVNPTTGMGVAKKPATGEAIQSLENLGDLDTSSDDGGVRSSSQFGDSIDYQQGPFRNSLPRAPAGLHRKQSIQKMVYMHWAGRAVQTDIEIPPGEERPVGDCVAWLQDPTLAAIKELKQQIPEVVEEVNSTDAESQTVEAWPRPSITVEGELARRTRDQDTQANPGPTKPAVPAPYPEGHYQETIVTDAATRTKLKDLTAKSELTPADRAFLAKFVMTQTAPPNREILHNVWRLAQPAACAPRMPPAKAYSGSVTAGDIFGPMGVLVWPLRLLWDSFHGLDQADASTAARTTARGEQAALDPDSTTNSKPKPTAAPRSRQAALLRTDHWPSVAWSILTVALYFFVIILLLSNLHMYRSMKQEQNFWVRANEPSTARFASPGYWRVCQSGGWGWRWRALIREWIIEHGRSWPA